MSKIKVKCIMPIYTIVTNGSCNGDSFSENVITFAGNDKLEEVRKTFKSIYDENLKNYDLSNTSFIKDFSETPNGLNYSASFEMYYEGYYDDNHVSGTVSTTFVDTEVEVDINDLNLSDQFWFNEAKNYATRYLEDNKLTLPEEVINEICEKVAKSAPNNEYLWDQIDFAFGSDVREAIENKI